MSLIESSGSGISHLLDSLSDISGEVFSLRVSAILTLLSSSWASFFLLYSASFYESNSLLASSLIEILINYS